MEENKSKEEQYNEARILHKSLDEKLQMLQEKPYLTEDEELEVKLLKKRKAPLQRHHGNSQGGNREEIVSRSVLSASMMILGSRNVLLPSFPL